MSVVPKLAHVQLELELKEVSNVVYVQRTVSSRHQQNILALLNCIIISADVPSLQAVNSLMCRLIRKNMLVGTSFLL